MTPASPKRTLFESDLVRIGTFRAVPGQPFFHDSGPIARAVFVFPRTSVSIQHAGGQPFIADPNLVTYYNPGQVYWRQPVDPAGDRCEWFHIRNDVLIELVGELDPGVRDRPDRPFPFARGPSDASVYLVQRRMVQHLLAAGRVDRLGVEEATLALLSRLLPAAYERRRREQPERPAQRELVEHLKAVLTVGADAELSLDGLARRVGYSPFHLSRTFRRVEGMTIHQYRLQQRLRGSLDRVAAGEDLSAIGLDLGFSSHSHFTATFRRAFGITPSAMRRTPIPPRR